MATADGKTTIRFNTQPPEGGCGYWFAKLQGDVSFNTQPPEGGCFGDLRTESHYLVSTHSHPKVAAYFRVPDLNPSSGFNTQPPEGGCRRRQPVITHLHRFNTQPPEGGCNRDRRDSVYPKVSTHSHPKVAAPVRAPGIPACVCFNTQPPEGGCRRFMLQSSLSAVPTHSHPKVAAVFKHLFGNATGFQHTATRRWLPAPVDIAHLERCFNTQPPEGGCISALRCLARPSCFNTQPPEGGCLVYQHDCIYNPLFQHTATRRWLRRAPISAFSDG